MSDVDSRVVALKRDYKANKERLGYKTKEVATSSNLGVSTVKRFEDIEANQEWLTAYKICKAVGINIYDYFDKAVTHIGPGKLIKYEDLDSISRYTNVPINEVFTEFQEEFIKGGIFFTGKLNPEYEGLDDKEIINTVDGGRKNNGYQLMRNGLRVEGFIKSLTLSEVRKLSSTK